MREIEVISNLIKAEECLKKIEDKISYFEKEERKSKECRTEENWKVYEEESRLLYKGHMSKKKIEEHLKKRKKEFFEERRKYVEEIKDYSKRRDILLKCIEILKMDIEKIEV